MFVFQNFSCFSELKKLEIKGIAKANHYINREEYKHVFEVNNLGTVE